MHSNSIEQKIAPPGEKKQVRGGTRLSKGDLMNSDAHYRGLVDRVPVSFQTDHGAES
jgi:hypothetical protein